MQTIEEKLAAIPAAKTETRAVVPVTTEAAGGLKSVRCYTDNNEYATFLQSDLGFPEIEEGEGVVVKLAGYPRAFHGNACFKPCAGFVHLAGFDGSGDEGLTAEAAKAMLDENGCLAVDLAATMTEITAGLRAVKCYTDINQCASFRLEDLGLDDIAVGAKVAVMLAGNPDLFYGKVCSSPCGFVHLTGDVIDGEEKGSLTAEAAKAMLAEEGSDDGRLFIDTAGTRYVTDQLAADAAFKGYKDPPIRIPAAFEKFFQVDSDIPAMLDDICWMVTWSDQEREFKVKAERLRGYAARLLREAEALQAISDEVVV